MIAVTHAPEFGLLYFMTVDPTSQLMSQPANQHTYLFIILVSVGEMLHKRSKVGQILKEFMTYSKHLVLLTGGWQGGGGLRKTGSFTTISALSSELQHTRRQRVLKKTVNFTGLVRCSHINVSTW